MRSAVRSAAPSRPGLPCKTRHPLPMASPRARRPPGLRACLPLLLTASLLLPGLARAEGAASAPTANEARAWLARIHAAARTGNYQGTLVFSSGGTMSSSRVAHYAVDGQTFEELESLDGLQQRIVRHDNAVHTLWPQSHVAVFETRETLAAWSATPQEVNPQALEQYVFVREGRARVAGRTAVVIRLEPRDTLRYAQRLWADQASGLMLRADVIGPAETPGAPRPVLESTAFSQVLIGVKPQPEDMMQVLRGLEGPEGYRVVRPQQQRTSLEREGWALTHPVPGFQLAGCVRRGMHVSTDEEPVLQAVFTDGLTHVSVFLEPYRPDRHRQPLQAQQGATGSAMLRRGEHWVTVVGDVPMATLTLFADAVERRRP